MKLTLFITILFVTFAVGCGRPSDVQAATPPATSSVPGPAPAVVVTPAPAAPVTPPPPAVPAGDLHGFAPDAVVAVTFKEINEKGYPIVVLRNLTGRDIETIRGAFHVEGADGTTLHATGLTIAVPGQVFIPADGAVDSSPYGLNRKVDAMNRLANTPATVSFRFEAQDVTFLDTETTSDSD